MRKRLVVGAVVLVLAGLGWGAWTWTHPDLFPDLGSEVEFRAAPVSRAGGIVAVAYGPEEADPETITLSSVSAHVVSDTARSRITFLLCTPRNETDAISSLLPDDDPAVYCSRLRPITSGTEFHLRDTGLAEYLLMRIEPTRPGSTHVAAIDLDYRRAWRHGGQRGTDRSEQDVVVHATSSRSFRLD